MITIYRNRDKNVLITRILSTNRNYVFMFYVANDIGDCWQTAWSTSLHKNTLLVNAKAVKAENSPYLFHNALIQWIYINCEYFKLINYVFRINEQHQWSCDLYSILFSMSCLWQLQHFIITSSVYMRQIDFQRAFIYLLS